MKLLGKKEIFEIQSLLGFNKLKENNIFKKELDKIIILEEKTKVKLLIRTEKEKNTFNGRYLEPFKGSDELTISNFLEGLEEIKSELNQNNFKGTLNYNFYDSKDYLGGDILGISVKLDDSYYSLSIKWETSEKYSSKSNKVKSILEKRMDNYIGPNKR